MSYETPEPRLRSIAITVCENCIAGKTGECHMPGCLFIRWHIDDVPDLEYMFTYLDEEARDSSDSR